MICDRSGLTSTKDITQINKYSLLAVFSEMFFFKLARKQQRRGALYRCELKTYQPPALIYSLGETIKIPVFQHENTGLILK